MARMSKSYENIVLDDSEDEQDRDKKTKKNKIQQYVDHAYVDYAIVEEDDLRLLDENSSLLPNPTSEGESNVREKLKGMSCTYGPMKKNAGGVVQPFPGKLLEVLDRSDLVDVINWMPHGRAFIVKKPKTFTINVLPRFFKQTKFLSFTRQLNLWEFKRITRGVDTGAYYHELFLRGRPYLAMRMKRQKIKGTGMKLTPNPEEEPDFYNDWPAMPPLSERRLLRPLPPLPAERLGLQGSGSIDWASKNMLNALQHRAGTGQKQVGGSINMDHVSENMLTALKYGASSRRGFTQNTSFLPPEEDFLSSANQNHRFRSRHLTPHQRYSDTNPFTHNDHLLPLTPEIRSFDNTSRMCYRDLHQCDSIGNAGVTSSTQCDTIDDEFFMPRRGNQQTSTMSTDVYSQQLSYDRLLRERLRDLDRAQQIKREQQDVSLLRRASLFDYLGSTISDPDSGIHSNYVTEYNSQIRGPFELSKPPSQLQTSQRSVGIAFEVRSTRNDFLDRHGNGNEEANPVELVAQHALATSSSKQQNHEMSEPNEKVKSSSKIESVAIDRPSFGRPFIWR